ncbi:MAG TPA: hypothetical protein VGL15_17260 [Vicinamibacteria bacterium]
MTRASRLGPGLLVKPLLLAAPLLLPALVPLRVLTPGLAFAVTAGRWLVVLGAVCALVSLLLRSRGRVPQPWPLVSARAEGASPRLLWPTVWAASLLAVWAAIPSHRWNGDSLGGDEPKYLRMAESLYHDLDVDMAGEASGPLTAAGLARNVRYLGRSTVSALASVAQAPAVPAGHQWNLGNWTLAGRNGGRYYLQSPGLPALLLPAVALQHALWPDRTAPLFAIATLGALWSIAFYQTARLAAEVSGSRLLGLLAGGAIALSPPVLIGGYHFYPEAAAAAAVPWLFRYVRLEGPQPGRVRAAALGLTTGGLIWLHPKFLPIALTLGALLLIRLRHHRSRLILAAGSGLVPVLALLLFDRQVTGLLRPDAFYRRYGDEMYTGPEVLLSSSMPTGLVNGLFAARDGALVMAPVLAAGLIALPLLWRRDSGTAIRLAAVFASLWVPAAVHSGGAAGPPGRLLAPVAVLLAVPLAAGLVELRSYLPFRWTVIALALVSAAMSLAMLRDFRRAVNPYRGVFASNDVNFAQDLPDAVRGPDHLSAVSRTARDLGRGAFLAGVVAFWAWAFSRARPGGEDDGAVAWKRIRDLHLGWWATIAVGSVALHALGA